MRGKKGSEDYDRKLFLVVRKRTLANWLLILFPSFPIVYMLRATNIISDDLTLALFEILGSISKIYFSYLVMDANLQMTFPSMSSIDFDKIFQVSQKEFLRYIFHELGVPLNTIAMIVNLSLNNKTLGKDSTSDDKLKNEDTIKSIRYPTIMQNII